MRPGLRTDVGAFIEIARGAKGLIKMEGDQTILEPREITGSESSKAFGKKQMTFSFGMISTVPNEVRQSSVSADKSYWSAGARDEPQYASQQTLYDDLGVELLDHSFEGFNTCIFACEPPSPPNVSFTDF